MKLNNVKRISKEDLAKKDKDMPAWIDPMLETLNAFIEQVTTALNGNLTFSDNMLGKEVTLEFTSAVEQVVSPTLDGRAQLRPYAVVLADTNGAEADSFKWRVLSNGKLGITITFVSATRSACRILIYLR
jgi:hypothetical protein